MEPKYLRALRTPGTNRLNCTIPELFTHLFNTYGNVTPSELRKLTYRVENLNLPPSKPVDSIFTEIDKLAVIAEIAKAPMTATQKINMAYILFSKQHVYKSALRKWDEQLEGHQDWEGFKEHLRFAYRALKRTGALTIKDTLDRHEVMNMVTAGITNAFHTMQNDRLPTQDPTTFSITSEQSLPPPLLDTIPTSSVATSATSTVSDITMQMMQQLLNQMATQQISTNGTNSSRRNPNTCHRNPNQRFYCWRHGACNHPSREYRNKGKGHQDDATFENRMGGSTRNIQNP